MGPFAQLIIFTLKLFEILIVIRAILSWFPDARRTTFAKVIHNITEPIYKPVRNLLAKSIFNERIPFDISPIIIILIIELILQIIQE